MMDPLSYVLGLLLGGLAGLLLRHLWRGWRLAREVTRQRRHAELQAWRRARLAGARRTTPAPRAELKLPYLGLDARPDTTSTASKGRRP